MNALHHLSNLLRERDKCSARHEIYFVDLYLLLNKALILEEKDKKEEERLKQESLRVSNEIALKNYYETYIRQVE